MFVFVVVVVFEVFVVYVFVVLVVLYRSCSNTPRMCNDSIHVSALCYVMPSET